MRKGLELPINVLVIVALAVIVLLGIIALYMLGTGGPISSISLAGAKQSACSTLIRQNSCNVATSSVDVQFDVANATLETCTSATSAYCADGSVTTEVDTLDKLLDTYYGTTNEQTRKKACGCPGY